MSSRPTPTQGRILGVAPAVAREPCRERPAAHGRRGTDPPTLEAVPALLASASIGHSLSSFFDAVGQFFSDLAAVHWGRCCWDWPFFGLNLTLRSRAFFHSLRAAYPAVRFQWRRIWGAYFAAVGFNNVVPARGGDVIKLFLARSSIPGSSYPTVAAAFFVESVFDVDRRRARADLRVHARGSSPSRRTSRS